MSNLVSMDPNSPTVSPEDYSWLEQHGRLVNAFGAETDRAVALLAAAYLDDQLKIALAQSLVFNQEVAKRLLNDQGPLGTLSARIDMVFALGLSTEPVHRELHVIRRIRNKFAHVADEISFKTDSINDLCGQLLGPSRYVAHQFETNARDSYLRSISFSVFAIRFAIQPRERPAIPTTVDLAEIFEDLMGMRRGNG